MKPPNLWASCFTSITKFRRTILTSKNTFYYENDQYFRGSDWWTASIHVSLHGILTFLVLTQQRIQRVDARWFSQEIGCPSLRAFLADFVSYFSCKNDKWDWHQMLLFLTNSNKSYRIKLWHPSLDGWTAILPCCGDSIHDWHAQIHEDHIE